MFRLKWNTGRSSVHLCSRFHPRISQGKCSWLYVQGGVPMGWCDWWHFPLFCTPSAAPSLLQLLGLAASRKARQCSALEEEVGMLQKSGVGSSRVTSPSHLCMTSARWFLAIKCDENQCYLTPGQPSPLLFHRRVYSWFEHCLKSKSLSFVNLHKVQSTGSSKLVGNLTFRD